MAAYKFDTLAKKTVAWTTAGGNAIEITLALIQESTDYFGDGDWKLARDGLNVTTTVKVGGKRQPDAWVQGVKGHPEFVYRIGAVGMTAKQNEEIKAAEAEVKAHPAWVAKQAATAAGHAASRTYEAHVSAVNKMMQPGGSY